jgi:hypothetical protein
MSDTKPSAEAWKLDCGDNSCAFAESKTGMRTNGGCRCLSDLPWRLARSIRLHMQALNRDVSALRERAERAEERLTVARDLGAEYIRRTDAAYTCDPENFVDLTCGKCNFCLRANLSKAEARVVELEGGSTLSDAIATAKQRTAQCEANAKMLAKADELADAVEDCRAGMADRWKRLTWCNVLDAALSAYRESKKVETQGLEIHGEEK